jgi:ATP-dependent RNA helicase DHX29
LTVYNAYCAWKRTRSTPGANEYAFCRKNFLSSQTLLNIEDVKLQLVVSIADAGLITLDVNQKASLNRARSTRQRHFFTTPPSHDTNNTNDALIQSVIAWSFYPKLLTREGKGWRNIANNQSVTLHPTSVNRAPSASPEKSPGQSQYLSYYHIMQGRNRNYNAFETSAVEDWAVAVLCGEGDFKMYPGVLSIDTNRLRFSLRDWKSMLAMKVLAARIREILANVFRDPQQPLSYKQRQWMDIWQGIWQARM